MLTPDPTTDLSPVVALRPQDLDPFPLDQRQMPALRLAQRQRRHAATSRNQRPPMTRTM